LIPETSDTRLCPFCAETIKSAAVLCRYCNRDIVGFDKPVISKSVSPALTPTPPRKSGDLSPGTIVGLLFIGLCVIAYQVISTQAGSPAPQNTSVDMDAARRASQGIQAAAVLSDTVTLDAHDVHSIASGHIGEPALTGYVINTSSRALRYIKAEAEFTNKSGTVVATAYDNTTDTLQPGDKWRFDVTWPNDVEDAKSGSISKVTGTFQ
jgi:hypothetical protein